MNEREKLAREIAEACDCAVTLESSRKLQYAWLDHDKATAAILPLLPEPCQSLIPLYLDDGTSIICDTISGGADAAPDGMPRSLTLVHGEKRARYMWQHSASYNIQSHQMQEDDPVPRSAADLGAIGCRTVKWQAFADSEPEPHKHILVTNNLGATNVHGEPSHMWLVTWVSEGGAVRRSFNEHIMLHNLTHWRYAL